MGAVTRPSSGDRAEHVSLLGHQLDPSSAREARVTKQSAAPVAIFLTCAVLFFTSCVFVLVLGAHPAAAATSRRRRRPGNPNPTLWLSSPTPRARCSRATRTR